MKHYSLSNGQQLSEWLVLGSFSVRQHRPDCIVNDPPQYINTEVIANTTTIPKPKTFSDTVCTLDEESPSAQHQIDDASRTMAVLNVHVAYTLTLMTRDNRSAFFLLCFIALAAASWEDCTWEDTKNGLLYNFTDPNNGHYGYWHGKDWTGLVQWTFTLCQPIVPGLVRCNTETSVCRERSYSWWWPYYAYPTSVIDQSAVFDEPTVPGAIASFRQRGLLYGDSAIVDLFCDPTARIESGEVSTVEIVDGVYKASWKLRQICNKPTKTTASPVVHQLHE
ncbi:hypothetical protein PROFUN_04896 [Planoprotostelium fungivorum]|uniref:Uncharacterized protein n=1 Tax=Planoprotostelium fungivorum TaxID=1890364 RepID=A0A2P6NF79_9EUKA|nr:hypothetical protein PROFUN_04896 [Planoprotostelium fungivorum]